MAGIDFLAVVDEGAQEFAAVLANGDLQAPVPSCPPWSLFELGDHLGGVHQWARHAIVEGSGDGEPTAAPRDRAGVVAWYQDSSVALLQTLRSTPIDAPAWHFGAKPRAAGWWHRRQAHEISMHLWDAQNAMGAARPIGPALAADGIDEVRHVFFPRQVRLNRIPPLPRSLALVVDETGDRYVFSADGTGPDTPETPVDATITGPAEVLLLALWHRAAANDPRLRVSGDPEAVSAVLSAQVTP